MQTSVALEHAHRISAIISSVHLYLVRNRRALKTKSGAREPLFHMHNTHDIVQLCYRCTYSSCIAIPEND